MQKISVFTQNLPISGLFGPFFFVLVNEMVVFGLFPCVLTQFNQKTGVFCVFLPILARFGCFTSRIDHSG